MPEGKKTRSARQKVTSRPRGKGGDHKKNGSQNEVGRVSRGGIVLQGDYNEIQIQQITQVFQTAHPSIQEEDELLRLKETVPQKIANLKAAVQADKTGMVGNPYHLLEALDVSENDYLGGRSEIIEFITGKLKSDRFVILIGKTGIGKTSLLRAGLIPAFVSAGHWPIWIETSREPLDSTIKKHILGSLNDFPALAGRPLKDVLRLSSAFLKESGEIILLLDDMEMFFQQSLIAQDVFADLWKECVNEVGLRVRWLFSTVDIKPRFNRFQSGETNPYANLMVLPALDHQGAREAVLTPARKSRIKVDDAVTTLLLDDLGSEVDPTRLQIVCHTLAGDNTAQNKVWKIEAYEKLGRADGILSRYLDHAILELPRKDRDSAWQVLSSIEGSSAVSISAEWLERQLGIFGYYNVEISSLLDGLQRKHLIVFGEDGYRLASDSMKPRIREWREQEAIPKQIQKETARQLERIRNSILRGLLGGSIGFGLFRWIVGNLPINIITGGIQWLEAVFLTLLYAMIGGLIGLLLMFFVDISSATKMRLWIRYLIGAVSGAIAFGLALSLFVYLNIASDTPIQKALLSALEGSLWGLAAGAGIIWGMTTKRPGWLFILTVPLASGVMLILADSIFNALARSQPAQIAAGGWVFPFFIALGARVGRRTGGGP